MAKNVSVFLQKKVEQGIQQGAEKIRNKIKEHEQKRGFFFFLSFFLIFFFKLNLKERGSVKKLFGIPLEDAVLVGNHSYEIPFIVEKVIQYVEQNREFLFIDLFPLSSLIFHLFFSSPKICILRESLD